MKENTIKEIMGEKGINKLKDRFEEIINSPAGAIILIDQKRILDTYQGICKEHLMEMIESSIDEYKKICPEQIPNLTPLN